MNKLFKRKGGFSLMEVVVAMAIVVMVTASALTIAMYSTTSRVKDVDKNRALNCAHNIVECFKASTNASTFETNFAFAENAENAEILPLQLNRSNNNGKFTVNHFTVSVDIDDDFSTIKVTVTENGKNGKQIAELSYTKYASPQNGGVES